MSREQVASPIPLDSFALTHRTVARLYFNRASAGGMVDCLAGWLAGCLEGYYQAWLLAFQDELN